jgi:hypothetical protein
MICSYLKVPREIESFTDHKGESVGTFETNQNEGYQLKADLDKNRHDFLRTLRSFDSTLKAVIDLFKELTCPRKRA